MCSNLPLSRLAGLTLGLIVMPALSHAWSGMDADSGAGVEIEAGNLVRTGRDIEVYDSDSGDYRNVTVESIRRSGGSVEVEVYDHDSGDIRTLEMSP